MVKNVSPIRIATRGSRLALWQANTVADQLEGRLGKRPTIHVIKTTGDRIQDRYLHEIGGKGLFIKELEQALLAGEADIAVHSLKDMPAVVPAPFTLSAILARHAVMDALIIGDQLGSSLRKSTCTAQWGAQQLGLLPAATIGTVSLRRSALLTRHNPKLQPKPVRGNVDTRLGKLRSGQFDAILLAKASVDRLGLAEDLHTEILDPKIFIPCAGQGALAIECLENHPLRRELASLDDLQTRRAVSIERGVLAGLGGDCTMPFGAYAYQESLTKEGKIPGAGNGDDWNFVGIILAADGSGTEVSLTFSNLRSTPEVVELILQEFQRAGASHTLSKIGLQAPASWH